MIYDETIADGERQAAHYELLLFRIVHHANALCQEIRKLQSKEKIWDCLLDGATNYDFESDNPKREVMAWIEKYGEKYAELFSTRTFEDALR